MPKTVDFPKRRPTKEQKQKADIRPEHYQQISRATMGFEFNGDFFDRYWTCHFIEYKHKSRKPISDETELYDMLQSQKYLFKSESHKQPWRQRRVLELILFDRILEEITRAAEEIMNKIRTELKIVREDGDHGSSKHSPDETSENTSQTQHPSDHSTSSPQVSNSTRPGNTVTTLYELDILADTLETVKFGLKMRGDRYLLFSEQPEQFEQILRLLDDDLGESLQQIERWMRREDDRKNENPRWTRKDELRYRTTITKMVASNERKIRELERCRMSVQSLRASL